MPQKEHGCRPSREHIIFPQFKQFGAGSNNGWIVAEHVHFRLSAPMVGLVDTSSAAMAAVKSEMLLVVREPPPLEELAFPLCFCLLVFDRTFGSISERTGPEAEGGALDGAGMGDCAREDAEELGADRPGCRTDDDDLLADM